MGLSKIYCPCVCISDSEVPLHILFTDDRAVYHFVMIPMIMTMMMMMISFYKG